VLIFNTKHLTIQIVGRLKFAVVTWRGLTPSHVYKEGTIQSLETLRDYPSVNRIILDAKDHKGVLHDGIESSVKSTIDYLGIAHGNYRVAVITPIDVLAKSSYRLYVELLNDALKKRFVVRQFDTMKEALAWLFKPKFWSLFAKEN